MRFREHEPRRREERPESTERPPPAHDVLALQRSAGNRAVSALLAREPKPEEPPAATAALSKIGVIPLLSFSHEQGSIGRQRPKNDLGAITCVSQVANHSSDLQKAVFAGTIMDAEIVHKTGFKIERKDVTLSSYSAANDEGAPTETWTIMPGPKREED
jgi:hypothetical protein